MIGSIIAGACGLLAMAAKGGNNNGFEPEPEDVAIRKKLAGGWVERGERQRLEARLARLNARQGDGHDPR